MFQKYILSDGWIVKLQRNFFPRVTLQWSNYFVLFKFLGKFYFKTQGYCQGMMKGVIMITGRYWCQVPLYMKITFLQLYHQLGPMLPMQLRPFFQLRICCVKQICAWLHQTRPVSRLFLGLVLKLGFCFFGCKKWMLWLLGHSKLK